MSSYIMGRLGALLFGGALTLVAGSVLSAEDGEADRRPRFDHLVKRLNYNPDDLLAGDELRSICREDGENDRCIDALNQISDKHPNNKNIRYQVALSYVDEVPGHSLFRQGWLSTRSMNHMTHIIEQDAADWTAYYIRGLNAMYWPRSFRRLDRAIEDLQTCIELSEQLPRGLLKPYHALAYLALGDAHVKNLDIDKGLEVYRRAKMHFNTREIEQRLAMNEQELSAYVDRYRNADHPVNTDISFLIDGGANRI